MREGLIMLYATALGFGAAGLIASFLQLVTNRPVAFAIPDKAGILSYVTAALRFAIIGPYIIARMAFRAAAPPQRSLGMLGGGLFVATLWSTCSGILVLGLAVSLMTG